MHKPRKRFGQNFLRDAHVIHRIIQLINPQPGQVIAEIGPGLGALTKPLLRRTKKLHAIELDRDLISPLKIQCLDLGELIIHNMDVLKFDFSEIATAKHSIRLVGNLPYNISTQLIFHCLKQKDLIQDMYFMLQKEVVERIVAQPGSKTYGRLSIMVQYHYQAQMLFIIDPKAFHPAPKVHSAIIHLTPHESLPHPVKDYERFETIVREAFNHRRKTIHNALKGYVDMDAFEKANIDPGWRPEQISIAEFVNLVNKC